MKTGTKVLIGLGLAGVVALFAFKKAPSTSGVILSEPPTALPADFDPAGYLALNPDVADDPSFSTQPGVHYLRHGWSEGRRWR